MKLRPVLHWQADGNDVDARLLPLLHAIAQTGSLKQAVTVVGLSYRHAWGLLVRFETALGQRVVESQRGRGAQLTALGKKLLVTDARIRLQLDTQLGNSASEIGNALSVSAAASNNHLTIQASHDMALAKLREMLGASRVCELELHFQGSLDCLAALSRGQCDVAGFHVPDTPGHSTLLDQYRPWLRTKSLRLLHFATRTQGLMVAKSNPLKIRTLGDLARTKARFVNRQPGSGTRLYFDHLLGAHQIRPAQINGYQLEEFTHGAVAATIGSGMADAGFGIEAAARQQKIDFVPIATERYFLAARAATWARPGPAVFLQSLRDGALKKVLRSLPGYTLPQNLELLAAHEALSTA